MQLLKQARLRASPTRGSCECYPAYFQFIVEVSHNTAQMAKRKLEDACTPETLRVLEWLRKHRKQRAFQLKCDDEARKLDRQLRKLLKQRQRPLVLVAMQNATVHVICKKTMDLTTEAYFKKGFTMQHMSLASVAVDVLAEKDRTDEADKASSLEQFTIF